MWAVIRGLQPGWLVKPKMCWSGLTLAASMSLSLCDFYYWYNNTEYREMKQEVNSLHEQPNSYTYMLERDVYCNLIHGKTYIVKSLCLSFWVWLLTEIQHMEHQNATGCNICFTLRFFYIFQRQFSLLCQDSEKKNDVISTVYAFCLLNFNQIHFNLAQ